MAMKALLALVLLLASTAVQAFDSNECDVYVFRTMENALWHCGDPLPFDPIPGQLTALYCDHSQGDWNNWPFAWASTHPDDWCDFMVATVRRVNNQDIEGRYPLSQDIALGNTPGPNEHFFSSIKDWGCYMVDEIYNENTGLMENRTTASYLVNSMAGETASDVNQQCERWYGMFDYWNLSEDIRNLMWWGHIPGADYEPQRNKWGRCHYDHSFMSPNYNREIGVEYKECDPGYICELKYQDYAACFPDPAADHECCVSWNNKCENVGDCCAGSECNEWGFCDTEVPMVFEDPPGICDHRDQKTDRALWSRCYDTENNDCAEGYKCEGNWWFAQCEVDPTVKTDCCLWDFDTNFPRPGDCCTGWYAHCHEYSEDGECLWSQCIPGRETGVDENGNSMLGVSDGLCSSPPIPMTFNEHINECTGAVCGMWGDPHIITCDDLHYDCQAVGLFTLMKNHMFDIQANFVSIETPWGGASITNDLAIDYIKDQYDETNPNAVPTFQVSFPNFDRMSPDNPEYDPKSRFIGNCPVLFYVDQELVDISNVADDGFMYGDMHSDYSAQIIADWSQINFKHLAGIDENGQKYYSSHIVWIEGSGPFTEWSCILSYFICLPREEEGEFIESSLGLLGTPTKDTRDDWMAPDGQTLVIPDHDRIEASFNYCVENWCVTQDQSFLAYEEGLTFEDYKCEEQVFEAFDVYACPDPDAVIEQCKDSDQMIACQMEACAGNPEIDREIEVIDELTKNSGEEEVNLLEFPDVETDYGDCANLGAGLSASTGKGSYSLAYPQINAIYGDGGFTVGHDNSLSVLVGGNFHCKSGAGFEGRGVFMKDAKLDEGACGRLAATIHGSLIQPFENTVCIEVGRDLEIDASFAESKMIMYEFDNSHRSCHLLYGRGCTLNGVECGTNMTVLEENHVHTHGDFKRDPELDLSRWRKELTLLKQKTNYWSGLPANGVATVEGDVLTFDAGPDHNPVQIFKIDPISSDVIGVVFSKGLIGKTIMIIVKGSGDFNVPAMCFHPADAMTTDAPICGKDTFPSSLTSSIAWVFPTRRTITMDGYYEFQGSIIMPRGDLIFKADGHSGRMIVGGSLTIDGYAELHNYEFDPASGPLPLPDKNDLDQICEVVHPPACDETIKPLTSTTACPSRPDGVVKLLKSSAPIPENEPILYDIIIEDPKDMSSAKTVKFKVDSPFANFTDIYVKHVKKVGKHFMDPVCESMPFTPGCNTEAPEIEVGCHEYPNVDPFALVSIYFASKKDETVLGLHSDEVAIDKCCRAPQEYENGNYGIVEYTFEIQCTCPEGIAQGR